MPKDAAFVIVLKFQRFQWGQLINATACSGGYLQVVKKQRFDNLQQMCLSIILFQITGL